MILPTCTQTEPLYYNKGNLTYLMIHKCASTSIKRALGMKKKSSIPDNTPFTVIRNPIDRAASIYSEMVEMGIHRGLEFSDWLVYLQGGFYDSHQIPMSYWLDKCGGVKVFTSLNDASVWLNVKIPRTNQRKTQVEITPEGERLIGELWADDIELYERLKA